MLLITSDETTLTVQLDRRTHVDAVCALEHHLNWMDEQFHSFNSQKTYWAKRMEELKAALADLKKFDCKLNH